jgi:hypothetical protein
MTCGRCNGTGTETVFDAVDYGSARVTMATGIVCRECLDRSLCPKCGEPLVYVNGVGSCSSDNCGWHDEDWAEPEEEDDED